MDHLDPFPERAGLRPTLSRTLHQYSTHRSSRATERSPNWNETVHGAGEIVADVGGCQRGERGGDLRAGTTRAAPV
jgi:hypothetical protein